MTNLSVVSLNCLLLLCDLYVGLDSQWNNEVFRFSDSRGFLCYGTAIKSSSHYRRRGGQCGILLTLDEVQRELGGLIECGPRVEKTDIWTVDSVLLVTSAADWPSCQFLFLRRCLMWRISSVYPLSPEKFFVKFHAFKPGVRQINVASSSLSPGPIDICAQINGASDAETEPNIFISLWKSDFKLTVSRSTNIQWPCENFLVIFFLPIPPPC